MSRFEDQLFADLMREHGAELAALPVRAAAPRQFATRRLVWVAAGAVATAAAATVGWGVVAGGTPAYAVTPNADGTVTVSLKEINGVAEANAELRKLHVRATAVPMRADCTAPQPPTDPIIGVFTGGTSGRDGAGSVTFDAGAIPTGDTVILAAQQLSGGRIMISENIVRGPAPSCVPVRSLTGPAGPTR